MRMTRVWLTGTDLLFPEFKPPNQTNQISLDSQWRSGSEKQRWLSSEWCTWWPSSQHHALSSCSSTLPCTLSSISPPHDHTGLFLLSS
ncbi:hypothetical protein HanRHA438_Chr14g0668601 [Helianthus annuus]|nr:hypothetical protein HanRHA438_Chr14g0668601 [Helianthus annuus]